MKTLSLKEKLKDNLRTLHNDDVRQYHLTHDFYSGRKLNSNVRFNQGKNDHEVLVEQKDLDAINELLFPHPTMGNAFADALSGFKRTAINESHLSMVEITKPAEDLLNHLNNYYDEYLESGLSVLLQVQSDRLAKNNIDVIQRAYPGNTVIVQNICILSEFWIRNPLDWKPENETSLLEHLFVEYQAPSCLKKCWYITATQENLQWLIAFILYAQGGSVKQIAATFNWVVTSSKLWHQLFQAPTHLSPEEAILYCEFQRLKGTDEVYKYITGNQAYTINLYANVNQDTVEFWYSAVRWLILNESQIIGTEMARILIWARHQFTEFAKAGKQFTMNGRSYSNVQNETQEYHRAIVARRLEIARRAELRRLAKIAREAEAEARAEEARNALWDMQHPSHHWDKLGFSWPIKKNQYDRKDQWVFVELCSSEELESEGQAMQNCVGGYDESCNNGFSAIVSLRYNDKPKVTIEIDPETRTLVQASGYENQDISQAERKLIKSWLKKKVSN